MTEAITYLRTQLEALELAKKLEQLQPLFYTDDGEMQDSSQFPGIDYRTDSITEILQKIGHRKLLSQQNSS